MNTASNYLQKNEALNNVKFIAVATFSDAGALSLQLSTCSPCFLYSYKYTHLILYLNAIPTQRFFLFSSGKKTHHKLSKEGNTFLVPEFHMTSTEKNKNNICLGQSSLLPFSSRNMAERIGISYELNSQFTDFLKSKKIPLPCHYLKFNFKSIPNEATALEKRWIFRTIS